MSLGLPVVTSPSEAGHGKKKRIKGDRLDGQKVWDAAWSRKQIGVL